MIVHLNKKRFNRYACISADLPHIRRRDPGEDAALPDWPDAQHLHDDQEVCRESGESSCIPPAGGHLSTAHR